MHTFPGQTRLMWSLQTPPLYDIFCISTNSACSSVFFQAWISMCHWTLLNASISIVDRFGHEFCFASPLGLLSPALQHRSAATPQLRSVWDVWDLGIYVDKSSNLLEISPITLFSTNLDTKNEIKWSSRKGNHVCHILSFWLHGVVLYLDFALQLNA